MTCTCEDIIIEVSEEGIDGNGIASIELLSESGLTKTYRINFTNGSHFDYTVTDGNGIARIEKTSTAGLVDTYTIYMTDGVTTYTFTVTNGRNGEPGVNTWGSIEGDINDQTDLKEALDLKADKADSYTKDELDGIFDGIDNALDTKADADSVYTKAQTDNLLSAKANAADLGALAEMDAIDYTSDKLTNKPTLGALASKDTVNYETEVTNKPTLGTMAAEDASDYYEKEATDALLDEKADIIITSASGSLVHLTDAAAMPVKALSVGIDPVQDLHGYDNPWPAGGGVNLLPVGGTFDVTENDMRFQSDGKGKYTISGTSTATAYYNFSIPEITLPAGDIYLHLLNSAVSSNFSFALLRGSTQVAYASANASNRIVKLAELSGATIDTLRLYVNSVQTLNFTVQPMLMLTNTASSYVPYSNVCPITGHSSAVVTRTGKNFLGNLNSSGTVYNVQFTVSDGVITASGTSNRGAETSYNVKVPLYLPAGTYTLNGIGANGSSASPKKSLRATVIKKDGTTRSYNNDYGSGVNFTVYDGDSVAVRIYFDDGATFSPSSPIYPMIRLASVSDATWESYQGTSVTIDLDGTRYGGTLDVLTGTLTVDRVTVDLGTRTWSYNGTRFASTLTGLSLASKRTKGICSSYPVYNGEVADAPDKSLIFGALNSTSVYIKDSAYSDPDVFQTALSGVQVVYELETPTTVPLSPATLSLLKGENNLWSDTGDTSVTYRADTKLYIDKVLSDAVAQLQALILEH